MKVAFDCDGTLIDYDGKLRLEMCRLLVAFVKSEAQVIVWSGGGQNYAAGVWNKVKRHFRNDIEFDTVTCLEKDMSIKPDLAIDDQDVSLGLVNLMLPPVKEGIAQSQASLTDQLMELKKLADKHGLYDASDFVRKHVVNGE